MKLDTFLAFSEGEQYDITLLTPKTLHPASSPAKMNPILSKVWLVVVMKVSSSQHFPKEIPPNRA